VLACTPLLFFVGKGRGGRRKGGERGGITRARHWSKRLSMAVRFRKRPMGLMMAAIDYISAVGRRSRPLPAPVPAETDATIPISIVPEMRYRKALYIFP
jgi:hypothetical protein